VARGLGPLQLYWYPDPEAIEKKRKKKKKKKNMFNGSRFCFLFFKNYLLLKGFLI